MAERKNMNPETKQNNTDLKASAKLHWLVRPTTIKMLWVGGITLLAFVTWLGTTVHPHIKFGLEGTWVFYSWYGFVTCVAMVLVAKFVVGQGLSRKDTYYDD